MKKLIDTEWFESVDSFKENDDGSIQWYKDNSNGFIKEGMNRSYSEQTGTEMVVVGQTDPVYEYDEETSEQVLVTPAEDITEEQPVFEEVTINVWDKLHELVADGTITIEPYVQSHEEQRQALKQQRDQALQDMVHDFGDGRIVQVRISDLVNFEVAINAGVDRQWIMADNTIDAVTVDEMIAAVNSGKSQATAIYDNHITALNALNDPE